MTMKNSIINPDWELLYAGLCGRGNFVQGTCLMLWLLLLAWLLWLAWLLRLLRLLVKAKRALRWRHWARLHVHGSVSLGPCMLHPGSVSACTHAYTLSVHTCTHACTRSCTHTRYFTFSVGPWCACSAYGVWAARCPRPTQ